MNNSLSIFRPAIVALRPVAVILWRVFEGFAGFMDKFWQICGVLILAGMWGLLLLNAIARWTGILPIGWSLEITAYMVAWSIFVMMGPITRSNEHIKVTFLPEKILGAERGTSFMNTLNSLVGLFICTYLSYHAYRLVAETHRLGLTEDSSGGWEYPMWIVRSGIFLGFSFAALYYFEHTVKWIMHYFTRSKFVPEGGLPIIDNNRSEEVRSESGNDRQLQ